MLASASPTLPRLAGLLLAAATASGCSTADPPGSTLGTIADPLNAGSAFVPLSAGQDVTLVEGAQGGFHVWMKFRVGLSPRLVSMEKRAYRASDNQLVLLAYTPVSIGSAPGAESPFGTVPAPGGAWELQPATPMFMCPSPVGINVLDTPIRYQLTLLDKSPTQGGAAPMALAEMGVTLVPHCPSSPPDSVAFCRKICSGN